MDLFESCWKLLCAVDEDTCKKTLLQ